MPRSEPAPPNSLNDMDADHDQARAAAHKIALGDGARASGALSFPEPRRPYATLSRSQAPAPPARSSSAREPRPPATSATPARPATAGTRSATPSA
jgi:hypothetical protein